MNEPVISAQRKLMFTVGGQEFADLLAAKKHGISRILAGNENDPITPEIGNFTLNILGHADEVIAILRTKERVAPPGPQPGKPRKPRKLKAQATNPTP